MVDGRSSVIANRPSTLCEGLVATRGSKWVTYSSVVMQRSWALEEMDVC